MAIYDRECARNLQKRISDFASSLTGQYPYSSLALEEDGSWTVQLRFPYATDSTQVHSIRSFGAQEQATVKILDEVGPMRHLVG